MGYLHQLVAENTTANVMHVRYIHSVVAAFLSISMTTNVTTRESEAKMQYETFILLLLYYPPNSAYIDAIRCCELVGRAMAGTTHNHVRQLT